MIDSDASKTQSARCFTSTFRSACSPDSEKVQEIGFFTLDEIETLGRKGFADELPLLKEYLSSRGYLGHSLPPEEGQEASRISLLPL